MACASLAANTASTPGDRQGDKAARCVADRGQAGRSLLAPACPRDVVKPFKRRVARRIVAEDERQAFGALRDVMARGSAQPALVKWKPCNESIRGFRHFPGLDDRDTGTEQQARAIFGRGEHTM